MANKPVARLKRVSMSSTETRDERAVWQSTCRCTAVEGVDHDIANTVRMLCREHERLQQRMHCVSLLQVFERGDRPFDTRRADGRLRRLGPFPKACEMITPCCLAVRRLPKRQIEDVVIMIDGLDVKQPKSAR